jgi:protein gp37
MQAGDSHYSDRVGVSMSDKTNIEWTDATWNVLVGCTKITDACKNCSAIRDAHRLSHNPHPKIKAKYEGTVTPDGQNWTGRINFSEPDLRKPFEWTRPRRIFPNYTSDWSHANVRDEWRDAIFGVITQANWHTYQLLTKRADIALDYLTRRGITPMSHVWLGFSAGNQTDFDKNWQSFKALAAAGWTIFVSCEPLLGLVVLPADFLALGRRAQILAGGESGAKARPSHPDWFRSLRDQCEASGVAFLFKQWGEWWEVEADSPTCQIIFQGTREKLPKDSRYCFIAPNGEVIRYRTEMRDHVPYRWMKRMGKKKAGRMLDGREHNDMPSAVTV